MAEEIVEMNMRRFLRGLSLKEIEILEMIIPDYFNRTNNDWTWDDDGVWRKRNSEGNVLAFVEPGVDLATMAGPYWIWAISSEDKNVEKAKHIIGINDARCPFEARKAAEEALRKFNDSLDKT